MRTISLHHLRTLSSCIISDTQFLTISHLKFSEHEKIWLSVCCLNTLTDGSLQTNERPIRNCQSSTSHEEYQHKERTFVSVKERHGLALLQSVFHACRRRQGPPLTKCSSHHTSNTSHQTPVLLCLHLTSENTWLHVHSDNYQLTQTSRVPVSHRPRK